jgi:4-hydroxybenzoyl-CoA thioesterase
MDYSFRQKVLFKHCDPAGIVFFPRYFEMMNDCVETFFHDCIGMPFESLHKTGGLPTVKIETHFARPSRHGDHLVLTLVITKVGGSSAGYRMQAVSDGELRFDTSATLVHVDERGRPAPWPDEVRERLLNYKGDDDDA